MFFTIQLTRLYQKNSYAGKEKKYPVRARYLVYLILLLSFVACAADKTAIRDEPLFIPEESFKKANELIQNKNYVEARELLETIKVKDASQKYAPLARLRIADTYFNEESFDEAVIEYESFLDVYSDHQYASYAQYKLAMCFFQRIKSVDIGYSWAKRALREFEKLQQRYPRNPYMDILDTRIMACMNILAEYEYYVGNFYYKKGSYNAAIGRFNGMLKDYPHSVRVPEALYYTGLSYEQLGQGDEAIHSLTALIDRFPATELSIDAKKRVHSLDKEQ